VGRALDEVKQRGPGMMITRGTYKINVEATARKQVLGLIETTKRLLKHVGTEIPDPPDTERQIQAVIDTFNTHRRVFDSFAMTIGDSTIEVRTSEGEVRYEIKQQTINDQQHTVLHLHSAELGELTWEVTEKGKLLFIDGVDGLSEYAFERTQPSEPSIGTGTQGTGKRCQDR
jgi:hypothetical protein